MERLEAARREAAQASAALHALSALCVPSERSTLLLSSFGEPGRTGRPVVLDDLLAAIGELFLHVVGEEEAHIQAHDGAESNELVRPHLALAVEDVPQALAVDGCATRELGDTDAARVPRLLHPYDDQLRVIHPLNRLPSVRLFCVPESSTTPD